MKSILTLFLALMIASPLAAQPKGSVHIKNATVITITGETLENTDVLVQNGLIARIGRNLVTPRGVETVDATGKFLLPGIIDAHSHLALASVNEATSPVTAEVRMSDVVNAYDIGIYRALAGGVTVSHAMHGSANVIGGQGATLKHHYGETAENLLMRNAPRTIKFALGENPTRVHGQGYGVNPRTRMGVEQIIRETFDAAKDYKRRRAAAPTRVAKDERLEVISDILDGKILVHCHSYRADEILMLMRVFNDYGIKNYTMQHANEAFKVAPELAKNGVHTSVFADWWAYKFEVYYSTSYNAAILNKYGVINSINSDSEELIRHLNHEAAKVVRYGGASELDALKMITINPAIQLGIEKRVGSIEVGKEADLALWSGHPLSIYSIAEKTWVDGVKRFDMATDRTDMRLRTNPADKFETSMISESGRHSDACMQGVLDFFTFEAMEHSHE
jgi:imidazolonepropionase-like amidohydrolase